MNSAHPALRNPKHTQTGQTAVLAAFFHNPTYTVPNFSLLQQNPQQAGGRGSGAYRRQGVEQNQKSLCSQPQFSDLGWEGTCISSIQCSFCRAGRGHSVSRTWNPRKDAQQVITNVITNAHTHEKVLPAHACMPRCTRA